MSGTVRVEVDYPIATLTLTRPPVNALNRGLSDEILKALDALAMDEKIGAVVLTGAPAGTRDIFCAGADIKEFEILEGETLQTNWPMRGMFFMEHLMMQRLPIIGAINGAALGGGLELVLACDFVIAASTATFGFPEAKLGVFPGNYALSWASRVIGPNRTRFLAMTGDAVDARWMLEAGMISEIVPRDQLLPRAREVAKKVGGLSRYSVQAIREIVQGVAGTHPLELKLMLVHNDRVHRTRDARERVDAFLTRRPKTESTR